MKKLFLTLVLAFVGIMSANAQLWIGGSANAAFQKDNTEFKIAPEIGYSFNEHWTVAAGLAFRHVDDKTDIVDVNFNQFCIQPYVRYTACTIEKFSLFCDLAGDIDLLSPEMYAVGLRPGIAWMATKHWTAAFRFGFLGYDHLFERGEGFFLDCGLGTSSIGLYYNF